MEDSTRYSNWQEDEPDNDGRGGSDYAVMSVAKAGKWEDMSVVDTLFPFVCKYYNATCPQPDQDEQFKDYPLINIDKRAGNHKLKQQTCMKLCLNVLHSLSYIPQCHEFSMR